VTLVCSVSVILSLPMDFQSVSARLSLSAVCIAKCMYYPESSVLWVCTCKIYKQLAHAWC